MQIKRYGQMAAMGLVAALLLGAPTGCKKLAKRATKEAPVGVADEAAKAATEATEQAKDKPPAPPPEMKKMEQVAAAHILVAFKGAMRADPKITRTKEEAEKLAKELSAQIKKDPAKFDALVKEKSDAPDKNNGGSLGMIPAGLGNHPFAIATKDLKVGDVAEPVETPFGYHIIKRTAPPPQYAGSHILVAYKGAMRADPKVTRTKEDAQKECAKLAEQARKDPTKFADMAKKHSDGPSGAKGGSLGKWFKGMMVPEFDKAIEGMKIGDISDPIETPFGFHIILRQDPSKTP